MPRVHLGLLPLFAVAAMCGCGLSETAGGGDRIALADVVPGATITQPFGCTDLDLEPFDPFCPSHHIHTGIDLGAPRGTAVHAATGGRAHLGFDPNGAGLYVAIDSYGGARVLYCHLSSAEVGDGDEVEADQVVGEVGSTGLATGAHLHLEVDIGGRAVDPARWLAAPSDRVRSGS